MGIMKRSLSIILLFICAVASFAQTPASSDEDRFFRLERESLEELLNIKTSVASRIPVELRRTPGLVSVITQQDIRYSGARNLVDLLRQVPAFEFVSDVQGTIGLGVRGSSAIEGKVRVILDGVTYNEVMYGTVQWDRFPVDQIERIEIIRGPGSVIYCGLGEMAIVNIITKSPGAVAGSRVYSGYGQMAEARGRVYGGYQFGRVSGDTSFSALAHVSAAQRSDRKFTDFSGSSYRMNGNSELGSKNLNVFLGYKGLGLRFIADDFRLSERDHFDAVLYPGAAKISYPVYSFEVKDSFRAAEKLRLESKLAFQYSRPWHETDRYFPYDKTVRKYTGGLTAFYEPGPAAGLMGGAEFVQDKIAAPGGGGARYDNLALFAQASMGLPAFTFTAGSRLDSNSNNGTELSPRLALTSQVNDFNFKAIYSGGFRAPTAENIALNSKIAPERTTAAEFEAGYKASDTLFFTASAFDITIRRTILYFYNPVTYDETYVNSSRTGTRGGGLGLKYSKGGNYADLGYIIYSAAKNRVTHTQAAPGSSAVLGLPRHKAVLNSRYKLAEKITASPSLIYLSKRYGYSAPGAIKAYPEILQANFYLHMQDCFTRGLGLGFGVYDIFGSNHDFIQSYKGGHAPLPNASREILLKADYAF